MILKSFLFSFNNRRMGFDCKKELPRFLDGELVIDPCSKTRCRNGGICQVTSSSLKSTGKTKFYAKCVCPKQYAGLLCEKTNLCLDKCLNGGTCEWSKENIVSCNCKPEFEGENCEARKGSLSNHGHHHGHNNHFHNIGGNDISDDTDSVTRGVTTILIVIISIILVLVIAIGIVIKFRSQRLPNAFRHRRMAESLLTGQTSNSREVPIGEFPNEMFLEDEPDDIEEERRSRGIVKNKGRFRLKSQYSRGLTSSSSANFVNPVYQNIYGDGEDSGNTKSEAITIEEHDNSTQQQNEDNENSFLLIPSTSAYDDDNEEDACDMVNTNSNLNRRYKTDSTHVYEAGMPMNTATDFESKDFLTEKHRGNINL